MSRGDYTLEIYDTTMRDGAQGLGVNFTLEDKIRISEKLDELGVHFIEAGWPDSNRTDREYFKAVRNHRIGNAKITAFGRTRAAGTTPAKDTTLQSIVRAEPDAAAIYGKSWDEHVRHVIRVSRSENTDMIRGSIAFLKRKGLFVIYDAEHFFDGYASDAEFAIDTLKAAEDGGADRIVLCDTNGGRLPDFIGAAVEDVRGRIRVKLGIHAHNDSDLAVANTIAAVKAGVVQVHGTINGYGERAGNANLCSIIPNLVLKMGLECIPAEKVALLSSVAKFVSELANRPLEDNLPYVGRAAFTHKGGTHMDAMRKLPMAYEHVRPESVGNATRSVVSDVSGRANVIHVAGQLGIDLSDNRDAVREILQELKELGYGGYQFEGAAGSFELIVRKHTGSYKEFFQLEGFKVVVDRRRGREIFSEATIKVKVGDEEELTVGEGNGPVDALNNALRKALDRFYPGLRDMRLTDYKVRVLDERDGTAAAVRVLITSRDKSGFWGTVGVSGNVLDASWKALVDSIEYKLLKDGVGKK